MSSGLVVPWSRVNPDRGLFSPQKCEYASGRPVIPPDAMPQLTSLRAQARAPERGLPVRRSAAVQLVGS
jgi:hypothetical protein